jgi:hypothetical protein
MHRASLLLLLTLLGCPAEQLGVHIPEGGPDAMSHEDLTRDVHALVKLGDRRPGAPGVRAGLEIIQRRLGEMKTLPAFGRGYVEQQATGWAVCGQKDGRSDRAVLIVALDAGDGAGDSAAPTAALISLAKSYDLNQPPPETLIFCAVSAQGGWETLWATPPVPQNTVKTLVLLGPLGEKEGFTLTETTREAPGGALKGVLASTGALALYEGEEDRMERLDYVGLVTDLLAVRAHVEAQISARTR